MAGRPRRSGLPLPWALRGLRNGVLTTRWPRTPDGYFDTFPAAVGVVADGARDMPDQAELDELCPTTAIRLGGGRATPLLAIDRGRCILCGRCVRANPEHFAWQPGSATATLTRELLVVPPLDGTDDALRELRAQLARRTTRLRRSVHIRHVDAGSDGSDEWEIQALFNPVYDAHRLGIFLTASPRHADILLVTGIGSAGMTGPLRRTREAMPDPVVVIATGVDAVSGGLVGGGYTGSGGIADLVDVDIWVPGSPAPPFALLHAILLALGRVAPGGAP